LLVHASGEVVVPTGLLSTLAAGVIAAAVATTVRVTVQCDYGFFGTGLLCTSSDKGRPPQAAGILVNRHLVFSDAVVKAVSFDFSEDMFEEEFGSRKLTVQGLSL
jgi:hypothetical protein